MLRVFWIPETLRMCAPGVLFSGMVDVLVMDIDFGFFRSRACVGFLRTRASTS